MLKHALIPAAALALLLAPAYAQVSPPAPAVVLPAGSAEIAPGQMTAPQMSALQTALNDQGFEAGTVDGTWGPNTAAALRRFQAKHALPVTGRLDAGIVAGLGLTGTFAPVAVATPAIPAAGTPGMVTSGTAAASGDNNQAVATTAANARQPAQGANSFTQAEAERRIGREGYTGISALHLDRGVWRGVASKNGQTVQVWLDYKGNIGPL